MKISPGSWVATAFAVMLLPMICLAQSEPAAPGPNPDFPDWNIVSGEFTRANADVFSVKSSAQGAVAFMPGKPGPRFEIEAKITAMSTIEGNPHRASIFLSNLKTRGKEYLAIDWQPEQRMVVLRPNAVTKNITYRRGPDKIPCRFKVQVWDGWVLVYINSQILLAEQVSSYFSLAAPIVGIGIGGETADISTTFESLVVKPLTTEPADDALRFLRATDAAYAFASDGKATKAKRVITDTPSFGTKGYYTEMGRFLMRSFENRPRIKAGQSIDLVDFGKDALDWRGDMSRWETSGNAFIAKSFKGFVRRELALDLTDYEFSYRIDWESSATSLQFIEVFFGNRNARHQGVVMYQPKTGLTIDLHRPRGGVPLLRPAGDETTLELTIRKQGDQFTVTEYDKEIFKGTITEMDQPMHGNIALQVYNEEIQGPVKFSKLKLTPLAAK